MSCFVCLFLNAEKLADRKLNVAEVTQSEIGQKQKLQTVLEAVHDLLRPHGWTIKWNVDCKCYVQKVCFEVRLFYVHGCKEEMIAL